MVAPDNTVADIIYVPLDCDLAQNHRHMLAVIGNMDGVHLGHQALVKKAVALAQHKPAAAIVFDPHPRRVFHPQTPPFLLTNLPQKAALLGQLGIQKLFVLPFIEALYKQSPQEFVQVTLAKKMGVSGIVTGADFQFGAKRAGDAATLKTLAEAVGMSAYAMAPVIAEEEEKYSSSSVRQALREGDPHIAAQLLGRPWALSGEVVEGRRLARTLNFPTANIPLGDYLRPKFGVYAITAQTDQGRYQGVANIGIRPTVEGETELLEAHLFDFEGDLYGKVVEVTLHHFLRPEQKFEGLPALQAQITKDSQAAKAWFS